METLKHGSVVFYRTTGRAKPLLPTTIEALATQHGVPTSLVPAYAGDRAAVARALNATRTAIAKQHLLLRKITATQTLVVHGIVSETVDETTEHLDHQHDPDANIRWDSEKNSAHLDGTHPVALEADQRYQELRGRIVSDDWTDTISAYLLDMCHAQPMRGDGRIYWIPPTSQPLMEPLKRYLADVGIVLFTMPVEPDDKEGIAGIQEAVAENLLTQLGELAAEVQSFDGTQATTTYKQRLEQYETLRSRCTMYRATLGLMAEKMQALLDQLASKVNDLLTLRSDIVVHKDGTIAPRKALPDTW